MKIKALISAIIVLCFTLHSELHAQTIHISPNTGSVIAAASTGSENHMAGYGGVWVHEQVSMVWMTSDYTYQTSSGLLRDHANNIAIAKDGKRFVICCGMSHDGYFALVLPNGYRFTSYKMILTNDVISEDFSKSFDTGDYSISETNSGFDTNIVTTSLGKHSTKNSPNSTEYTLGRTSVNDGDMGHQLYFRLRRNSGYAAVYVKSFEITFECANPFTESLRPTTGIVDGVDCTNITVNTGRVDLGPITWSKGNNTSSGTYQFRYDYTNIKDLTANFTLYNEGGIVSGTAVPGKTTEGKIEADDNYFFLNNDTYYIETPTEAIAQGGATRPLGYRITGAKLHYEHSYTPLKLGSRFYITDGNGGYLNSNLHFTSEPVIWNSDTNGKIWTGNGTYLTVEGSLSTSYTLSTTGSSSQGSTFVMDGNNLYYKPYLRKYYVSVSNSTADVGTSGTRAKIKAPSSEYTLKLYDKTGKEIAQETVVNGDNGSGYLEIMGLNNDAIKFEVSGLDGDARARIYAELTLEPLNPYVTNVDIVATTADGKRTIMRQYSTDDFMIANGYVDFAVPNNFAAKGDAVPFHFENLAKHNADETYEHLDLKDRNGNSRYHFVHSDYYNIIDENLQGHREEAISHTYEDKVKVYVSGNQAFKANNSEFFHIGTDANTNETYYFEKYRYSNKEFEGQGGKFEKIEIADGGEQEIYLMVCDETRYNIAPTTTPRHAFYTYYTTKIRMSQRDYIPVLSYEKIYDNAMLADGLDERPYYGVKTGTEAVLLEGQTDDGNGYLLASQIKEYIEKDLGQYGKPSDAEHILYIDASELTSIPHDSEEGKETVTIQQLQELVGDNAIVYLPQGTTANTDNIATESDSNDFIANANIILKDKKPFYAPYDIRVNASNYTEYTRGLTSDNGKVTHASLVIPFSVAIDNDGIHTNRDNDSHSFRFHNMQLAEALSNPRMYNNYNYEVTGHFLPVTGKTFTEPNKPYLVIITKETENPDVVFMIQQYGASIHKTPTPVNGISVMDGEEATGTLDEVGNVTFRNHGTLNGVKLLKDDGYFYFSRDRFVSSLNLSSGREYVYVMPFRTYYDYTGNGQRLRYMNISFEENTGATGIADITTGSTDDGLIISAVSGTVTVTALRDTPVAVQAVNGQRMAGCNMGEGETRTFYLPAGIYIINGKKVAVRN
ncbi:MAG: hypothetical protein K2G12_08075 [Prevotella sp.]|nr:hypothetical protein [Prevotella sp.]